MNHFKFISMSEYFPRIYLRRTSAQVCIDNTYSDHVFFPLTCKKICSTHTAGLYSKVYVSLCAAQSEGGCREWQPQTKDGEHHWISTSWAQGKTFHLCFTKHFWVQEIWALQGCQWSCANSGGRTQSGWCTPIHLMPSLLKHSPPRKLIKVH